MDRLESLGNQLSQITLYDLKSMYNQAKNVVLNVSEMEAKVREATNDDAWGASSTLMQEIAQGTFNFQQFNEIMPCIYGRFMEKEASQWREIYKALQLLEYIVKHGSERVVDDARAHISTIKMLRNFHYIDDKGKDQGINVRTRAKELAELLSDLDRVRSERRKAKNNRNKYTGVGNDGSSGLSFTSGGSRYGGFGSESLGGGGSGGFSGGGGYDNDYSSRSGAASRSGGSSGFHDTPSRQASYDEYDAGDYDQAPRRSASVNRHNSQLPTRSASGPSRQSTRSAAPTPPPPKVKEPEVDLLGGFGDEDTIAQPPAIDQSKPLPQPTAHVSLDDDFDDFQSAPPSAAPAQPAFATSTPPVVATAPKLNVFDVLNASTQPPQYSAAPSFVSTPVAQPNYGGGSGIMSPTFSSAAAPAVMSPVPISSALPRPGATSPPAAKPASSANFDDLWSLSLGGSSATGSTSAAGTKSGVNPNVGKSIKDLEKEKAQASLWAAPQQTNKPAQGGSFGGLDDLLL